MTKIPSIPLTEGAASSSRQDALTKATPSNHRKKESKTATSKQVKEVLKKFGHDERSIEENNDAIFAELTGVNRTDLSELPEIVRNELQNNGEDDPADDSSVEVIGKPSLNCRVHRCEMRGIQYVELAQFLEHHNQAHPGHRFAKEKCTKLAVYNCYRCNKVYPTSERCEHYAEKNGVASERWYPQISWSVTVAASGTDVPRFFLQLFQEFLDIVKCTLAIACLERGDKESNLHLQGAASIAWDPDNEKGLLKILKQTLKLTDYLKQTFRVQCKPFVKGQDWLAMIGYCQKWKDHREYEMHERGMTEADLEKGRVFLQVYRADYTKDKFVIDTNNIMKASYGHWTAKRKPAFVSFEENFADMLKSGDFALSGKLLCAHPLDMMRTEESWKTLLMPYETSKDQVKRILFGSGGAQSKTPNYVSPRYQLNDFKPSSRDTDLISFLLMHMLRRRENTVIVGPPGCGKTSLVHTITAAHGVRYCGTADELKDIAESDQFIVFDDFDFKDFSVDDVKRILDREMPTQRVKVRYNDAVLTNKMTRVVLCNALPEQFLDAAVQDR